MKENDLRDEKLEEILREFGDNENVSPDSEETAEKPQAEQMSIPDEEDVLAVEDISRQVEQAGVFAETQESEETADSAPEEITPAEQPEQTAQPEEIEVPEEEHGEAEPENRASAIEDDTVPLDFLPKKTGKVKPDTIRLDGIAGKLPKGKARKAAPVDESTQVLPDVGGAEPFSDKWEPEYEQPMGEYVPPQPIVFQPKSRLRELKKQLVAGPEKRYYEISETGFGKIQTAIFFSLIVALVAVTATVIYAMDMVSQDRMKLMVFGQFFTMLVSGLLGVHLMMDGFYDLLHGRFSLNTMLLFTFIACCIDGVFCLQTLQVPCCAAFCLQVTMALLSEYEGRKTEISQMDTMRRASRLDGIAACPDYYEGRKGFLRKEAQVDEFMNTCSVPSSQDKVLRMYSLAALLASVAVAVTAGVIHGVPMAFRVWAVTLLAALPATAFVTLSRPRFILENRLHNLGTVLCGWQGVQGLRGKAAIPLTYGDICPPGSIRIGGVKFYGNRQPDSIVAYAAAVLNAEGGGLSALFRQLLESRSGYHYDAVNFVTYDGGVGAEVEDEPVLVGSQEFLKKMGVEVPEGIHVSHAVCVAIDGDFCGLFAMTYEKVRSSYVGMHALCGDRKLQSVVIAPDFDMTAQFLQSRFGIRPQKMKIPEQKVRQELAGKKLPQDAPSLIMTTRAGLAPVAYGITGARALYTSGRLGLAVHLLAGILGIGMMLTLTILGAFELLTPFNMFLYQAVWMIPGFLITEWTRSA